MDDRDEIYVVVICSSDLPICVGASTDDMNYEEKDSQNPGSGNNTWATPALVQLSPGGENTKEP